ncbi:MAG: amidohydrolase family protein [Halobacteriota archaeon]|uniref:amidohydrolase family protein n=1 Tax=Natronomonas sp. TaxID=2184060 RepID=UPI00397591E4
MSNPNEDAFAPALDAHVHLFPERLADAIQRTLTAATDWEFSYRTDRPSMEATLTDAGVERYVALPYAHKPGIARGLNEWLAEEAAGSERLIPFATVHPDDEGVDEIVREAFVAGARGLKFHCPVQNCAPADPRIEPALEVAVEYDRPITYHGNTAPMYENDPNVGADRFAEVVESFPELRVNCAHMGTYEVDAFVGMAREHDTVYLDTTFAMSTEAEETMGFDPSSIDDEVFVELSGSIMYGSDFPNIPYPYRAERAELLGRDLPEETYRDIFYRTAIEFLGIDG